ncbi:hypothetical protein BH20CHL6_BH20CHL6_08480 [soil metagenome]
MIELPLFPLHSVLCPGVALPLHIFEERYRLMVARCIEARTPFGVVLIRHGRDTGPAVGRLADVGTTAVIREAGRYPDGRLDIMTVGGSRFRIEALDDAREPYLVGRVTLLEERVGADQLAARLAGRVGRRFLHYLELLQPALADDDGPEVVVEIEVEHPDADEAAIETMLSHDEEEPAASAFFGGGDTEDYENGDRSDDDRRPTLATEDERYEILMSAARRLTQPGDPTGLSYVLSGLVEVELPRRQALLEAVDTVTRLELLDALLWREIQLLGRGLKPLMLDPRSFAVRRN